MSITIVNIGHRPVKIDGLGVFFNDGRILGSGIVQGDTESRVVTYDSNIYYSTGLPEIIKDGEPVRIYYSLEELSKYYSDGSRIIKIIAWDVERREYKGKMPGYVKKRLNKFYSKSRVKDNKNN